MVGLKSNGLMVILLLSLGAPAICHGQKLQFRRLPPCDVEPARTTNVRRIPAVIQATAVQIVEIPPETVEPNDPSNELPQTDPPASEQIGTPDGFLPMPQQLPFDAEFMFDEYLIQPGDELEIKFRYTPELNEIVTVRPDGMISLQIVGDVLAADRTPRDLHQSLVAAFSPALKNPRIVVHVRRFAANHVFVGGEVATPSRVAISGQLSALQAIIRAGGFKDTADERRVILRRDGGYSLELNLKADLKGRAVGQDVLLRPYDVIYVPKTRIAKVNLFVDQYIEKLIPFQRSTGIFITREAGN